MRTRTIYSARNGAEYETRMGIASHRFGPYKATERESRKSRQWFKFEQELFRRLDERDTLTEQNAFLLASAEAAQANLAACRRELAKARAYISTIIGAPGEVSNV